MGVFVGSRRPLPSKATATIAAAIVATATMRGQTGSFGIGYSPLSYTDGDGEGRGRGATGKPRKTGSHDCQSGPCKARPAVDFLGLKHWQEGVDIDLKTWDGLRTREWAPDLENVVLRAISGSTYQGSSYLRFPAAENTRDRREMAACYITGG